MSVSLARRPLRWRRLRGELSPSRPVLDLELAHRPLRSAMPGRKPWEGARGKTQIGLREAPAVVTRCVFARIREGSQEKRHVSRILGAH